MKHIWTISLESNVHHRVLRLIRSELALYDLYVLVEPLRGLLPSLSQLLRGIFHILFSRPERRNNVRQHRELSREDLHLLRIQVRLRLELSIQLLELC